MTTPTLTTHSHHTSTMFANKVLFVVLIALSNEVLQSRAFSLAPVIPTSLPALRNRRPPSLELRMFEPAKQVALRQVSEKDPGAHRSATLGKDLLAPTALSTLPLFEMDFESAAEIPAIVDPASSPTTMLLNLQTEAESLAKNRLLGYQLKKHVLKRSSMGDAISSILASKLANSELPEDDLFDLFSTTFIKNPQIVSDLVQDLLWMKEVDPATSSFLHPFLNFKGFHAVQVQRVSHALWRSADAADKMLALMLQSRSSELFGVDAHPGAVLKHGVMLDHATGIVIGETARIGHHCYILHGVTLGATGKSGDFDRHPKIGNRVKIGAGAMVLGNIQVDDDAVVGASAVVTVPIGSGETVVGINRVLGSKEKAGAAAEGQDLDIWMFNI